MKKRSFWQRLAFLLVLSIVMAMAGGCELFSGDSGSDDEEDDDDDNNDDENDEEEVDNVFVSGTIIESITKDGITFNLSVSPLDKDGELITGGVDEDDFDFDDLEVFTLSYGYTEGTLYCEAKADVEDVEIVEPSYGEDVTIAAVILLDSSGSMSGNDPYRLRVEAAKILIDTLIQSDSAVAVADFGTYGGGYGYYDDDDSDGDTDDYYSNGEFRWLADFGSTVQELKDAADMVREDGSTPMFNGIELSLQRIEQRDEEALYIFVLTDGVADDNYMYDDVVMHANQAGVTLFTVALGTEIEREILQDLATDTGGDFIEAVNAEDLAQRFEAQGIAATQGKVIVTGEGEFDQELAWGTYILQGQLETDLGGEVVPTYFEFTFYYDGYDDIYEY